MQEIALLLSSFAGVATAAAVKKFPKNKAQLVRVGASPQIKNQLNSLHMEKDILTKTISRLYQSDAGLSKIQRDRLLLKYQHQLGIILAKIDKLDAASKHPDLGPIGDGLITLMDQKLSQLDQRLYELSSKIAVVNVQVPELKKETKPKEVTQIKKETSKSEIKETKQEKPKKMEIPQIEMPYPRPKPVELTTLTTLPKKPFEFPLIQHKKVETKTEIINEIVKPKEEKIEIIQADLGVTSNIIRPQMNTEAPKPEIKLPEPKPITPEITPKPEDKPKSAVGLPEDDSSDDDDDDDLDKIKGEIMKTLSKLEQAEVE